MLTHAHPSVSVFCDFRGKIFWLGLLFVVEDYEHVETGLVLLVSLAVPDQIGPRFSFEMVHSVLSCLVLFAFD